MKFDFYAFPKNISPVKEILKKSPSTFFLIEFKLIIF